MSRVLLINRGWRFRRLPADTDAGRGDAAWDVVELPHSAVEADLDGRNHWTGICEYTRRLEIPDRPAGGRVVLHVGAAMHTATVLVDGRVIAEHAGGYLPFEVDLTDAVRGRPAVDLTLRLDNRDDPDVPPGKPLADLDFCWYGGLFRNVALCIRPPVHLTDAVAAGEVAGGGLFIRTLDLTADLARLAVRAHARNGHDRAAALNVTAEVLRDGRVLALAETPLEIGAGEAAHADLRIDVPDPRPWSPSEPVLHELRVTLHDASSGALFDERSERFGIRRIAFSRSRGFEINGQRLRLRGTNRHQEYPYAGYAVPRAAQYRDARRIKEAGFDYVRLSHYPQSPDFLDACDELGIVVMNAIPGWQFVGGAKFQDLCVRHARELIRRDRNHPCVVLWELSLNETAMPEDLMARLHAAGHEEYPGDQMFTCGWIDRYDVFIHSRQHGRIHTWSNGDKALVVAEYGDWEYYATNEGFDQKTGAGVLARWSNSRHRRGEGERALRQQAWNHAMALNDTLASPAVLDGQWAVFDYARGYDPSRAAVGVMDVFRLPKFSYWFYRSQRDPGEGGPGWSGGPVVFIASHGLPNSPLRILVFSNCDEVDLRLNGVSVGRMHAERTWMTQHLPHPPFVFHLPRHVPGELEAVGFVGGIGVCTHRVRSSRTLGRVDLHIDDMGVSPEPGEADLLIAHAHLLDDAGSLCVTEQREVAFTVAAPARILGPSKVDAEAGIASTVIRVPADCRGFVLHARAVGGIDAACTWGEVCEPAAAAATES